MKRISLILQDGILRSKNLFPCEGLRDKICDGSSSIFINYIGPVIII
jgi:hypothetical protein